MSELLGITVEELVHLLKRKRARLPFEIGAFVALETAEQLLDRPALPDVDDVRLLDDGTVSVYAPDVPATEEEAAHAVVELLAHLLVAAGPGVPPVFLALVEKGPRAGVWKLDVLRDELEASLLPLNRAAARRVLSRLLRETKKGDSVLPPAPTALTAEGVDDDLDALLDDEPEPAARPTAPARRAPPAQEVDEDATTLEQELPTTEELPAAPARAAEVDARAPAAQPVMAPEPASKPSSQPEPVSKPASEPEPAPVPAAPVAATAAPSAKMPDLDGFEETGKGGRGLVWFAVFAALVAGLFFAVRTYRPDVFARILGEAPAEDSDALAQAAEERRRAEAEAQREAADRYGDLRLTVSPERAQVLLYVGRGPAVMEQLPVGVAHEFVAVADGKAPTRAVVPADAQWGEGTDGPLYELAMQTGIEDMRFEELDLGESRLAPDAMGQPSGSLGNVRVVTTPPGAKVYYLIGFGPEVRVRHLPVGDVQELLVYREGYAPERVVVAPSDYRPTAEGQVAEAAVELTERRRRR